MPTTNVQASVAAWQDLGVTIDTTVAGVVITCPGTVVFTPGQSCDANGSVATSPSSGFPVPLALFPSSNAHGFAILLLPIRDGAPALPPSVGGSQYAVGVAAPGPGPTAYTYAELAALGGQLGAGSWRLYGIMVDDVYGDNGGSWAVTVTVSDPPAVPSLTATPTSIGADPEIFLAGS